MANPHVGVNVQEGRPLNPISGASTSVASIIGNFVKGPLNKATLVTSFAQFQQIFGSQPAPGTTSYYSVKAFFASAGSAQLYIVRVASSSAAKASVTLADRQGSPANTLKIWASSQGLWGTGLSVKILDHNILSTTLAANIDIGDETAQLVSVGGLEVGSDVEFDNGTDQEQVRITSIDAVNKIINWSGAVSNAYTTANGSASSLEFAIEVYLDGILQETHQGLSMNDAVSFFCEKGVVSSYIEVEDLKATDTDYEDLPAVTSTAQPLTGGVDGLSDVLGADYAGVQANKTGVYALDEIADVFRICCPDPKLTDAVPETAYGTLLQALLNYVDTRQTVQLYAEIPYNKSVAAAKTFGDAFEGRRLALFYPWLKVTENSLPVWIPPTGAVLGAAVLKDYRRGVEKSVGNESIPYAADLKYHVSVAEGETLNDAGINTLRALSSQGIRVYGARTRSALTSWRFLDQSEYWNYLARTLGNNLQDVVFEPNNAALWRHVERRVSAFMDAEQAKGALFSVSGDKAYRLIIDDTNNPQESIAEGKLNLTLEYVKTSPVEKFIIELTSSPAGLSVI